MIYQKNTILKCLVVILCNLSLRSTRLIISMTKLTARTDTHLSISAPPFETLTAGDDEDLKSLSELTITQSSSTLQHPIQP